MLGNCFIQACLVKCVKFSLVACMSRIMYTPHTQVREMWGTHELAIHKMLGMAVWATTYRKVLAF